MRGIARRLPAILLAAFIVLPGPGTAMGDEGTERILVRSRGLEGPGARRALREAGVDRIAWSGRATPWHVLEIGVGVDPEESRRRLRRERSIEIVEPDRTARPAARRPDDLRPDQWSLDNRGLPLHGGEGVFDADIDAPEAWDLVTGSRHVVVAILDTGITTDHPDLAGNLIPGIDFTGSGMQDAWPGHGTAVAGIFGARGNNGRGMSGINWEARILPMKVCDATGYCPYSAIIAALDTAVIRGARVANLSVTCDEHQDPFTGVCGAHRPGACRSAALSETIAAAGRAGMLVVTAAGNCAADLDDDTTAIPCADGSPNVICVGATDARDEPAPFSNRGEGSVALAAPGMDIVSLSRDPQLMIPWDGTSFAAPMVSGVAALLIARHADFTPEAVIRRITGGADRLAALAGTVAGSARLNARGAIEEVFTDPVPIGPAGRRSAIGDFNGDGLADALASGPTGYHVRPGDGRVLGTPVLWLGGRVPAAQPLVGDLDGDGRDDLIRIGRRGIEAILSRGDHFGPPRLWAAERIDGRARTADVNGDGRADLVEASLSTGVRVRLSTGSSFETPSVWSTLPATGWTVADVDGDARGDLVMVRSGEFEVSRSTGSAFAAPVPWGPAGGGGRTLSADLDADGLEDVVREDAGGCWVVHLSLGDAFAAPRPWACGGSGSGAVLDDLDGDGRADLIRRLAADGWTVSRSVP